MKKKIVSCPILRLRKADVPELMNAVLDIVSKHDPQALRLTGMYNLLLELKTKLKHFAVNYNGFPLDDELVLQRKLRKKLLSSILSQLRSIEQVEVAAHVQQAKLVIPFLNSYLKGSTNLVPSNQSSKVDELFTDLASKPEVKTALSSFSSLAVFLDELEACQQKIKACENRRRETLSNEVVVNVTELKAEIATAISNLLTYIELAKVQYAHIDYMPLIRELNVLLTVKQSAIKSRTTRIQNNKTAKAIKTTTAAPSPTTDATAV